MNEEKLNSLTREEAICYLDNQMDYTYQLQQENEQLKRNCNIGNENLNFYREEYKKYKSVLDETREKIDFYIHYSTSDSAYMSYQQYKELLQILDKVKSNE